MHENAEDSSHSKKKPAKFKRDLLCKAIKAVIAKYLPIPAHLHVDPVVPKGNYGTLKMKFVADLFTFADILVEGM